MSGEPQAVGEGVRRDPGLRASRPTDVPDRAGSVDETLGFVSLVGAGPGDPELLTVRAAQRLASAEVVVHDGLVGHGVMALVPSSAQRFDVAKRRGAPLQQEAISALLVKLAKQGKRVVRLKGGDPFVFGRGGEEAQALHAAGVAFEVVPGVTSAVAAPAAAGIPVTHRGLSASFTVVTGHRQIGEDAPDWIALGRLVTAGGTLVILMGVAQRRDIAEALRASGVGSSTPVACIGDATLETQQVARGRLDQLADLPITPPSVLVIGAVAALDFSGSPAGPNWFAQTS